MRLLQVAAIGTALALSGCIDMDMNTEILGADEARVSGYMQVQRGMLDMMGGAEGFCSEDEGGTLEMTDTHARCNLLMEGNFADVFDGASEGEPTPEATDLGDGTVRVTFPIGAVTADAEEMRGDPQMVQMMRPMLEGHVFTLRISGAEIVSTNGVVSADGRTATLTFPLDIILDAETAATLPENFEAVVRY
jgi:hypothetical protein